MQGKKLNFYKIQPENSEHMLILSQIKTETPYLGDLTNYDFQSKVKGITGKNYFVENNGEIIGYIGLSEEIDTSIGKTVSLYYAVRKKYYGKGYGCLILDEITQILKENTLIDCIVANVNNQNTFGIRTIERANFKQVSELSDDEEIQYHKYLR